MPTAAENPKLCLRTNTDDEPVLGALPSAILALGPRRVGEPSRRASRPSAWVALSDQGDLALALEILAPALLRILTVVNWLSSAAATSLPGNSRNSSQKRCARRSDRSERCERRTCVVRPAGRARDRVSARPSSPGAGRGGPPAGSMASTRHGVIAFDGADGGPLPAASRATTLNVYVVPWARPVMTVAGIPLVAGVMSPAHVPQAGDGITW